MNLLTAGILAYVGSQVYQSLKRKAFTLTVAVPRGWVEVDEGMFRASRSDRAFVILHKTPEEVLAESQHYQAVKSDEQTDNRAAKGRYQYDAQQDDDY